MHRCSTSSFYFLSYLHGEIVGIRFGCRLQLDAALKGGRHISNRCVNVNESVVFEHTNPERPCRGREARREK